MERIITIKKTQFTIREVNVNELSLDTLQCKTLSLGVDLEAHSVTLNFNIRDSSTLVNGNDDIEDFAENIDEFEELQISDEYIIKEIYKLFKANPTWLKFQRYIRFTSRRFDKSFKVRFESNGKSHLKIIR